MEVTMEYKRIKLPKTINIPQGIIARLAPSNKAMHGEWYEVLIPIGKDETAYLYLTDDAIAEMKAIEPECTIY